VYVLSLEIKKMNQSVNTKFSWDLVLTAIAAIAAFAWGVSKLSEPTIGNVVGGIGWIVFSSSAAIYVLFSLRDVTHELARKILVIAKYVGLAIVLTAIFLPRSEP
jgi:hypothetical protein